MSRSDKKKAALLAPPFVVEHNGLFHFLQLHAAFFAFAGFVRDHTAIFTNKFTLDIDLFDRLPAAARGHVLAFQLAFAVSAARTVVGFLTFDGQHVFARRRLRRRFLHRARHGHGTQNNTNDK
jgi:hypothetical protein